MRTAVGCSIHIDGKTTIHRAAGRHHGSFLDPPALRGQGSSFPPSPARAATDAVGAELGRRVETGSQEPWSLAIVVTSERAATRAETRLRAGPRTPLSRWSARCTVLARPVCPLGAIRESYAGWRSHRRRRADIYSGYFRDPKPASEGRACMSMKRLPGARPAEVLRLG